MFSHDADLFFLSPSSAFPRPGKFSVLYLLRRDIDVCMGVNPTTGGPVSCKAEWPGAMAMLAGIDLLAKFFAGDDTIGHVGQRFRDFLGRFFLGTNSADSEVIYQLRNSLLHSFGLYSKDTKGKEYRFFLSDDAAAVALVSRTSAKPDHYYVELRALHREFEKAVAAYCAALDSDSGLQANFAKMFGDYGSIYID